MYICSIKTNNMKIEVKNQTTEKIEVKFPYYCKSTTQFYCVLNEKTVICIEQWCDEISIRKSEFILDCAFMPINTIITKEEFDAKLSEVKQLINEL